MKKIFLIITIALALSLLMVGTAWAATYSLTPQIPTQTFSTPEWAHGNYKTSGPDVCKNCHAVHQADASSMFLLRGSAASVSQACMVCHGNGVTLTNAQPYMWKGSNLFSSTSVAYTDPAAVHFIDSDAYNWTWVDCNLPGVTTRRLNCIDCHNVHHQDVTSVFAISAAYGYDPIIGNRIGPSYLSMTSSLAGVTGAYGALCNCCHNVNEKPGQTAGATTAFTGTGHSSKQTQTTMAYNSSAVGGSLTMGSSLVQTSGLITGCNDCHKRIKLDSNSFMTASGNSARVTRSDAYQLAGAFHGGLVNAGSQTTDDKLLSASVSGTPVDENCLSCHLWGSNGVGYTY